MTLSSTGQASRIQGWGGRAKDVTWGVWAGGLEEELVSGSKREQGCPELSASSFHNLVIRRPQVDNMRMTENSKNKREETSIALPTTNSHRQPHLNPSTSYLLWVLGSPLEFSVLSLVKWDSIPGGHQIIGYPSPLPDTVFSLVWTGRKR